MRSVTIGSAPDCDIVIDDPYVSARHCVIERPVGFKLWRVRDLGSTNGTRILPAGTAGGVSLQVREWTWLHSGDVLVIGRTRMPPFTPERVTS